MSQQRHHRYRQSVVAPPPPSTPPPTTARRPRTIRGLDPAQRREQRRADLLAATLDLVATHGYAHTSIELICQTAYVGTRAFYELFTSKEDCYLALLQQVSEDLHQRVAAALDQPGHDVVETERLALTEFAHALVDDPRTAIVTFGEAAGISPTVEAQRRGNRRRAATLITAFWRHHGILDPDGAPQGVSSDDHVLAVATIGGLFEIIADWLHDDPPQPRTIDGLIDSLTAFTDTVRRGRTARRSAP